MENDDRNSFEELLMQMNVIWLVVTKVVGGLPIRQREGILAALEELRRATSKPPQGMSARTMGMVALQSEIIDRFIREVPGPARE